MAKVFKCRIVIDTSVLRSSGTKSTDNISSKSANVLKEILNNDKLAIVVTPSLIDEYKRHQSSFAKTWQRQMYARRRIIPIIPGRNDELRERLLREKNEQLQLVIEKDCFLLEACINVDKTVVSLDKEIRNHFSTASIEITELREIVWVNPDTDDAVEWIRNNAEWHVRLTLYHFATNN